MGSARADSSKTLNLERVNSVASPRQEFLIAFPVFQSVYPAPFESFLAMMLHAASHEHDRYAFVPRVKARSLLHMAMNDLVSEAISNDFAGLIVCDDDCLPPFTAIPRLLRHFEAGHEVVCGMGYMRGYPFTTTIGRYFKEGVCLARDGVTGVLRFAGYEWIDDVANEPELLPCDFAGFPIALFSTAALKRMKAPWFGTHIEGGDCTHDVYFGSRAKAAGVQIFVDRTIDCGHLLDAQIITSENRAFARSVVRAQQGPTS
jgi:hypothetical protein